MWLKMTWNRLILHTNVVGNLIKPMFYFYTPKTSESQRFSDTFNLYRKEILTYNGIRLQTNIAGNLI